MNNSPVAPMRFECLYQPSRPPDTLSTYYACFIQNPVMATLPKCAPLAMCLNAAFASARAKA